MDIHDRADELETRRTRKPTGRYDICPVCDGDGWQEGEYWGVHTCPCCGGMGVVRSVVAPTVRQEDRTT